MENICARIVLPLGLGNQQLWLMINISSTPEELLMMKRRRQWRNERNLTWNGVVERSKTLSACMMISRKVKQWHVKALTICISSMASIFRQPTAYRCRHEESTCGGPCNHVYWKFVQWIFPKIAPPPTIFSFEASLFCLSFQIKIK